MIEYAYAFSTTGAIYYIYAESQAEAIRKYLEWNNLKALPKGCVITRTNA